MKRFANKYDWAEPNLTAHKTHHLLGENPGHKSTEHKRTKKSIEGRFFSLCVFLLPLSLHKFRSCCLTPFSFTVCNSNPVLLSKLDEINTLNALLRNYEVYMDQLLRPKKTGSETKRRSRRKRNVESKSKIWFFLWLLLLDWCRLLKKENVRRCSKITFICFAVPPLPPEDYEDFPYPSPLVENNTNENQTNTKINQAANPQINTSAGPLQSPQEELQHVENNTQHQLPKQPSAQPAGQVLQHQQMNTSVFHEGNKILIPTKARLPTPTKLPDSRQQDLAHGEPVPATNRPSVTTPRSASTHVSGSSGQSSTTAKPPQVTFSTPKSKHLTDKAPTLRDLHRLDHVESTQMDLQLEALRQLNRSSKSTLHGLFLGLLSEVPLSEKVPLGTQLDQFVLNCEFSGHACNFRWKFLCSHFPTEINSSIDIC